jgi:menaquinone-dependent protoporphyrinogen oxidase
MRVLVTSASKHGATAEIASAIAYSLQGSALHVSVVPIDDAPDVADYDAVVVGSAIYAGRWRKPARAFVEHNADVLAERPVWLFSSGPLGEPAKPDSDPVDVEKLVALTGALGHHLFAGKLDKDELSWGEKAVVSAVRAPEGDWRDWADVSAFAREIASELTRS